MDQMSHGLAMGYDPSNVLHYIHSTTTMREQSIELFQRCYVVTAKINISGNIGPNSDFVRSCKTN